MNKTTYTDVMIKNSYKKLGAYQPSKEVYPITHTFDRETSGSINNKKSFTIDQIRSIFSEIIGEYEHGTANIEDLFPENPVNVEQLSAILKDVILCLENWAFPGEKDES